MCINVLLSMVSAYNVLVYLYTTCACLPLLMVGNNKCVQSYTALVVSDAWFDLFDKCFIRNCIMS